VNVALFLSWRLWGYLVTAGVVILQSLAAGPTVAHVGTRFEAGISSSATLLHMNDVDLDARLRDMQRLGVVWLRVDFSWPAIQPDGPNVYHWGMYDRLVRVVDAHHMKILAVLDYTPGWAQEPRCAKLVITRAAAAKCSPADNDTFGRFARAAALRFAGTSVRAWEIWNEPNNSSYWKVAQNNDAVLTSSTAFAELADTAALQIRQSDRTAVIITGGLSPMFHPAYPKGISQGDFLSQILPRLDPTLFDGVGIHPYSWPVLPTKEAIYSAFYTIDNGPSAYNLRTIMAKYGWGNKQLWGTEFGAPTTGVSHVTVATSKARPDHVTETMQSQIIADGVKAWYAMPNVGPLFVHADSDRWLPQERNEGGFGLRRADGSAKPSYDAFRQAVARLP